MIRTIGLTIVTSLALLAGAVGCSDKEGSPPAENGGTGQDSVSQGTSDEGAVKDVVNKYHQAILDQDLEAAKAMISSDGTKKMLESMIEIRSDGMKFGGLPKILKVAIDGDTAVATCQFGPTEQGVDLVKSNGTWLVK